MNTLLVTTPLLFSGSQRVTVANPDGQPVLLDAAFTAH